MKEQSKSLYLVGLLFGIGAIAVFCVWFLKDVDVESGSMEKSLYVQQDTSDSAKAEQDKSIPEGKKAGAKKRWPGSLSEQDKYKRARTLESLVQKLSNRRGTGLSKELSLNTNNSEEVERKLLEYLREPISGIRGMLKECYGNVLVNHPNLGGLFMVELTIIADEEYGGLVESSQILAGGASSANQDLTECVRETMYALKLGKPPGGGRIKFIYPMIFSTPELLSQSLIKEELKMRIEVVNWK